MSPHEPTEDGLYRDPELAQFYDLDNPWGADLDYCLRVAEDARSVLDLGCGTGRLAARLADRRVVFGVDPAPAMLEIARRRPGGERVTWVRSDARSVRLDRRFDLVLMTGHAFQVVLTDDDQRSLLSTIAAHLAPGGRFVFDTRNPAAEAWREWNPEESGRRFEHPELGPVEAFNEAVHDVATGIVTYRTHYRVVEGGRQLSADSKIRFTSREALAGMLDEVGLEVEDWLGDWAGKPWQATAPEIIALGRLRERA